MYGAVIAVLAALYWRYSPIGVTAIAVLCAGDGFADIIGRQYGGSNKLPHSPDKVRYQLKCAAALYHAIQYCGL